MIGLLEIRRRKVQFALIATVVALISYLVLMINGLGVGLNVAAGSALRSFNADALAYSDESGISVIRSELSQAAVDRATALPGVEAAAPLGYVAANYRSANGEISSAAFLGFDPGTIAAPRVTAGRPLTPGDERGMLADRTFLRAAGLAVGDTVQVSVRLVTMEFTIVGEIDEGQFFFQPAVYILRDTWRELKYGANAQDGPVASIVLLRGEGLPGTRAEGIEVVSKSTAFSNIEGVSGQQSTVMFLRFFGYLIGALVIGVFFYVLTLQKIPNIGVLKALGASNFFVFRQLLVQAVFVAIIGLAVALPLAYLTNWGLDQLPNPVPIAFTAGTWVTTSILLVLMSLIGTIFSGRQVLRVDPIIALGQQQ